MTDTGQVIAVRNVSVADRAPGPTFVNLGSNFTFDKPKAMRFHHAGWNIWLPKSRMRIWAGSYHAPNKLIQEALAYAKTHR